MLSWAAIITQNITCAYDRVHLCSFLRSTYKQRTQGWTMAFELMETGTVKATYFYLTDAWNEPEHLECVGQWRPEPAR